MNSKKENAVIFGFGVRSTPRRQLMLGSKGEEGYASKVISEAISGKGVYCVTAFALGTTEHLIDLINAENQMGSIVESVKEGPRPRMLERVRIASSSDVRDVMKKVTQNYEKVFADVLVEKQPTPELEALPPYNGLTIMLQLFRYENEESFSDYRETNSLTFIVLPDAERPVLCGFDAEQQAAYEKVHRILLSAAGIVSSIKCSRLRIPFGKSKVSQLLRRAYNAEKGYEPGMLNGNTATYMFVHCMKDGKWAEESFHNLTMIRRMSNTLGASGIGSMLRDLAVDKWRLDQDAAELRDELVLAKTAYDYKPRVFEVSKQITNPKEEEEKQISLIQAKRDAEKEKQEAMVRQKAKEESAGAIKEQEAKFGSTLAELERVLETKKKSNAKLQASRDARAKECEASLEEARNKKQAEEESAAALKEDMVQLEEELDSRRAAIQSKQKQLEMAQLDKAKGREAILKEHKVVQKNRQALLDERKTQRQQWIQQIKDINAKVVEQINSIAKDRKENGETISAKDEASEKAVTQDIKTIEEYLPKLISLEDIPKNPDETENIRRQFEDVFTQEKQEYYKSIAEEKARKEKLEKSLEEYRKYILQIAQAKKKEGLQSAMKKQQMLNNLVDQVFTYLRQGVKMTKISSKGHVRRRFYFLSEDSKKIHSCELDNMGLPINQKKPSVTIQIKDIRKIVLGCYTESFVGFSSDSQLEKARAEAITDQGSFRQDATGNITPSNLGVYNYRSFSLLLPGGKSLDVVCNSDTDYEAWMVGLKRIFNTKSKVEKTIEDRLDMAMPSILGEDIRCSMKYGEKLNIRTMNGFASISAEEGIVCSESHIPPALFLRIKQEMIEKSRSQPVTEYDVRVGSGLDLIRCGFVYEYLVERKHIPLPV
ncbi:hypothetical protein AGDE_05085 [Angomonas deanei]|uniref:PH domain-containing protein n=1 Tax=Angomonas deanei TaxID=59799 RepID=A0A7G2CL90_9TRYP|nr:hypothetical protein AGDE_05085 [Angomonas deanei]CAD2219684.1 hypothetical protein, conserved [Angomonas deanei]|eukprot:EPY38844.1 hypothetical protein AGDE_05085 [Angomonas deanei]